MKRNPPHCFQPNEDFEQMVVVDWLLTNGFKFFMVPNEAALKAASRDRATKFGLLKKLKRMGLLPGAVDLVFITPTADGHHVVLEMKRDAKSKVSDTQKEVHNDMRAGLYIVIVGFGAEDAIKKISSMKWMKI